VDGRIHEGLRVELKRRSGASIRGIFLGLPLLRGVTYAVRKSRCADGKFRAAFAKPHLFQSPVVRFPIPCTAPCLVLTDHADGGDVDTTRRRTAHSHAHLAARAAHAGVLGRADLVTQRPPPRGRAVDLDRLAKALASQLIIWHHLALYGPMCDVARELAPALLDSLAEHARLVVQVFLVTGGFLAAHSLWPRAGRRARAGVEGRTGLVVARYVRLVKPYGVANDGRGGGRLVARGLIVHPTISRCA
jgi:hypothetical protein